ncbi:MAG: BlaI/MecI/CopY family transcriptional regulator [Candidatus Eremiobacteraeota bacterium]|nr:BlaI/MecI/CopY family transcriptional regulator [Candidatus Eremiobacteraeota bacterium]
MARKKSRTLTEAELRLMEVLWQKGRATVGDVTGSLGNPPIAYNTVLTTMRILEQKGFVRHEEEGRAFIYIPKIRREEASTTALDQLLNRFFNNSAGTLALKLIEGQQLDKNELGRLKELIEKYEGQE